MKKDDCIFCKLSNGDIPTNALYEDDVVKVIFDLNPASKGHVLILPKNHFANLFEIPEDMDAKAFILAKKIAKKMKDVFGCDAVKVAKAMKETLGCEGLNIVQNNGEIAGQTVFHFHMHIIPRYKGDTVNIGWTPGKADADEINELKEKIAAGL